MIKIKLIPNIINNKNRKEFQVKFENKKLHEIVNNIFSDLKAKEEIKVLKIVINGKRIENLEIKPEDNDEIIIVYAISGQEDWIAGITIAVSVVGAILFPAVAASFYVTAGLTALSWGYNKLARKPSYGSSGNELDGSSPTYGWDGIENTQAAGLPLAIIYGENKVGGNIINLCVTNGTGTTRYFNISGVEGENYEVHERWSNYGGSSYVVYRTLIKTTRISIVFNCTISGSAYYNYTVSYRKTSGSGYTTFQQLTGSSSTTKTLDITGLDNDYYDIKILNSYSGSTQGSSLRTSWTFSFYGMEVVYGENEQTLNMLLALGEGEVDDISGVYIDDNPITNYAVADFQIRKGLASQSLIEIFNYINNFFQVASKLKKDVAFNYTTYNDKITGFEINLLFPQGIWSTNNNGAYNSWAITLKIGYKLITEESYTEQSITFDYKSRSAYRNVVKVINLDEGQYDIRVIKTTNDPDNQYTFGECQIMTINEIKQKALTYPNTALLAVSIKASEQISNNIPTITSVVRGRKIKCPNVYNLQNGTYVPYDEYYYDSEDRCYRLLQDGSELGVSASFTTIYCANPIWCLLDLLTNSRYGLGNYISEDDIDIYDSFKECAKYCDTLIEGTRSKRLRLDIVIDSSASAIDIIQQITQAFRGFVFFTTGKIKVVIDKPETVTQMFSMANIIDGSFVVSKKSNKEYCNSIDITYYDKKNNYKQDVVTVEDQESINKIGIRSKSIRVFANTAEYARIAGEYFLKQDKYINEIISFKAAVDAVMCQPGDVIAVCHDNNSFNKSGRIISYEDGIITVDCELSIEEGKTYKIQIKLSDDTIVEKDVLNSESGTTREIEVEDDFTLDPQGYDIFSFYESTKEIKKYRITNMKKDEDLNIDITAIEYNEKIYEVDTKKTVSTTSYDIEDESELEFFNYIYAEGNAYIDPDILGSDIGRIVIEGVRTASLPSGSRACVFGLTIHYGATSFSHKGLWLLGSHTERDWGGSSSSSGINYNPYEFSYDFASYVSSYNNKDVFIFAGKNYINEMDFFSNENAYLKSVKVYNSTQESLFADLKPAKYNGMSGIYDAVRQKFYVNANSAGKLVVTDSYQQVEVKYSDLIDTNIYTGEEKMVKIVDLSADPQINRSVNLMEVAQSAGGRTDGVSFLARGTVSSGEIKLLGSFDGTNWFRLQDEEGKDIVLHVGVFTELKIRNRFVKCDLTDVTSSNLIVEVQ